MGDRNPMYRRFAQKWVDNHQPFKRELSELQQDQFEEMMSYVYAYEISAGRVHPPRIGEMALLTICLEQQRRLWEVRGYAEDLHGRMVDLGGEPVGYLHRGLPEFSGDD